jgi:hypothetical protein
MSAQALFEAAKDGRLEDFDRLAAAAKLEPQQRVHYARRAGSPAAREHILAGSRATPAFHGGAIAVCQNDVEGVRAALRAGLDFHAPLGGGAGHSTVHLAAVLGRTECLRAMIEAGVDVTRKCLTSMSDRGTPLAFALSGPHPETVELLLATPGVDPNDVDCVWFLDGIDRDLLATFVEHGLRWDFVAEHFAQLAPGLTPDGLERLIEAGLSIGPEVLARFFYTRGAAQRPDGEDAAVARALLARCAPPPSGKATLKNGEEVDLLERAIERLPLAAVQALLEAGVERRKVRIPSSAPSRAEKKALLAIPEPKPGIAMPLSDFASLVDEDLGLEVIADQLGRSADGAPTFGPLALGMSVAALPSVAPLTWEPDGEQLCAVRSSGESGQHTIEVVSAEGAVVCVTYKLLFNPPFGEPVPSLVPRLTALFGKPKKSTKQVTSWVIGAHRISTFGERARGDDDRFGASLELEMLDERHKHLPLRHPRFAKL